MTSLKYIELAPKEPAKAAVIWLHGLGASGDNFVPLIPELKLPDALGIRFIFPHAPRRPITVNQGYVMPGWYDIYGFSHDSKQDKAGIEASSLQIIELIEQEIQRGIPAERIILAGFSQGGAMALHIGLHYPEKLGGILALSTYLPLHDTFGQQLSPANRSIPIFLAHGKQDEVLPLSFAELSKDRLKKQGYEVIWKVYPMRHQVCAEEIQDISHQLMTWLSC